ncbi:hypothetical protein Bca52824_032504 [Brassica carinata]|uniref:Uncharacterized protein n=1 Tax=Brassica carinata TaxID=52824 RepID=A0A8X7SCT0_BRACI|nr:hypothetical protein Bca52824_032504 [Brassica carinata]
MKETLRCCIACILPFGALDVIRQRGNEGTPSYLPSSDRDDVISATKIVIVPPEAELQRGKIYFLMQATQSD